MSIAGDINGDGIDDILLSSNPTDGTTRRQAYVVYGKAGGIGSDFDLSTLNGTNGFLINGPLNANDPVPNAYFGKSIASAGDINGDGFDDIIIGAPRAPNPDIASSEVGSAYVILGAESIGASVNVEDLDGTDGFLIVGPDAYDGQPEIGDLVGSAGDINGDGYDDVIMESFNFGGGDGFIVFGSADFGTASAAAQIALDDIDGTNGFIISNFGANTGWAVQQSPLPGDFNGDGVDDLVRSSNGRTSILMGRAATLANPHPFAGGVDLDTLNGTDGFNVPTPAGGFAPDQSSRSAGDINADGIDDIVMASLYAEPGGKYRAGESYVIFGQQTAFPASFDLTTLDGTNGFYVSGANAEDRANSVSGVGDFSGDGIDDFVISSGHADPTNGNINAGIAYVIYGSDDGFSAGIDLATLDATQGMIINGFHTEGYLTRVGAGAGDVNGDGRPDFITGSRYADANGIVDAGEVYIIYGREAGDPPVEPGASLSISNSNITEADSGSVDMTFVVTLSEAVTEEVTVNYATSDLTATAGDDYEAISGVLTIPVGETSGTLTVQVNAGGTLEGDERFLLTLSNANGADIQYAVGTWNDHRLSTKHEVLCCR